MQSSQRDRRRTTRPSAARGDTFTDTSSGVPAARQLVDSGEAFVEHEASELVDEAGATRRAGMNSSGQITGAPWSRFHRQSPSTADDAAASRRRSAAGRRRRHRRGARPRRKFARARSSRSKHAFSQPVRPSAGQEPPRRVRMAYGSLSIAGDGCRARSSTIDCAPSRTTAPCRVWEKSSGFTAGAADVLRRNNVIGHAATPPVARWSSRTDSGAVRRRGISSRRNSSRSSRSCSSIMWAPADSDLTAYIVASTTRCTATPTTCSRSSRPLDLHGRRVRRPFRQRDDRRARRESRSLALRIADPRRTLAALRQRRRVPRRLRARRHRGAAGCPGCELSRLVRRGGPDDHGQPGSAGAGRAADARASAAPTPRSRATSRTSRSSPTTGATSRSVTVPTLVIQCTDDAIAPLEVGEYVHEAIPRSTFTVLSTTGHIPILSGAARSRRRASARTCHDRHRLREALSASRVRAALHRHRRASSSRSTTRSSTGRGTRPRTSSGSASPRCSMPGARSSTRPGTPRPFTCRGS